MARKGFASVTIHKAIDDLVLALAEKNDRSKSWVIEEAVKLYIQQHEGEATSEAKGPQAS
jgi:predicted transcriptional regulator